MQEPLRAREVIRQSEQGYSVKPFIIRADNDEIYFVKGLRKTGGASLISEALSAELGKRLGLPIPDWKPMIIPPELISFSPLDNIKDLSGGIAFASKQVENSSDLLITSVAIIPEDIQQKVLAFDWWIRNADRALSEKGGNVNLLLNERGELAVIDHNSAFDATFSADEFRDFHVFRDQIPYLRDMVNRLDFNSLFSEALLDWQDIVDLLPEDWLYSDTNHTVLTKPELCQRLKELSSFIHENFWGEL